MRRQRRRLRPWQRRRAAQRLVAAVRRLPVWRQARHVAAYMPADGEIDVLPLLREARRQGKRTYLPVLHPLGRGLRFRPWAPGSPMRANRFGIPEPRARRHERSGRRLDLVLAPLVAFDDHGNRLGMGGGFYDRTFAFRSRLARWRRPRLVGVGYAFQRVPRLERRHWDVRLDTVLTEAGRHRPDTDPVRGNATCQTLPQQSADKKEGR